jgi:hypothetical protein
MMPAEQQLAEWTPLLASVPDAARIPRAGAAHTHIDDGRGSSIRVGGDPRGGSLLSLSSSSSSSLSRPDRPRRRPFAREAAVWGALSLFACGAGAAVYGAAFSPPVRLLLRRHAELLYAFPYAMCAIVLLAAAALPQPSSTRRARSTRDNDIGGGGGGRVLVPAGAAAAVAIAVALTLAFLWGIAIGLCLVALGVPPALFVALPLAVLFCMSKFSAYLAFYTEAHRLGMLDDP